MPTLRWPAGLCPRCWRLGHGYPECRAAQCQLCLAVDNQSHDLRKPCTPHFGGVCSFNWFLRIVQKVGGDRSRPYRDLDHWRNTPGNDELLLPPPIIFGEQAKRLPPLPRESQAEAERQHHEREQLRQRGRSLARSQASSVAPSQFQQPQPQALQQAALRLFDRVLTLVGSDNPLPEPGRAGPARTGRQNTPRAEPYPSAQRGRERSTRPWARSPSRGRSRMRSPSIDAGGDYMMRGGLLPATAAPQIQQPPQALALPGTQGAQTGSMQLLPEQIRQLGPEAQAQLNQLVQDFLQQQQQPQRQPAAERLRRARPSTGAPNSDLQLVALPPGCGQHAALLLLFLHLPQLRHCNGVNNGRRTITLFRLWTLFTAQKMANPKPRQRRRSNRTLRIPPTLVKRAIKRLHHHHGGRNPSVANLSIKL